MADQKISELTLGTPTDTDIIPFVDLATGTTKKAVKTDLMGASGYSGISGYSGASGISGFSGFSGISGYSGTNGTSGYSGFSGISGFSGFSGISGFSGYSGTSGFSGSGVSGYSGYSGASGLPGGSLAWKGQWLTSTDYVLNDAVYQNGSSYLCLVGHTSGTFATDLAANKWSIFAQSGFSGISGFSGYSGISGYSGSGVSGYSGYSGISGFSGYSGISGYSGFSGISGYSGYSGSGVSGYSGATGTQYPWKGAWLTSTVYAVNDCVQQNGNGYVCLVGHTSGTFATDLSNGDWSLLVQSGFSGYSGYSGISGYSGTNGTSGYSGYSGISGYSGTNGTSGYSGYSGISGYSGYSGISGYSGYSGISGYSGVNGTSGYSGYSGISGYSGAGLPNPMTSEVGLGENAGFGFDNSLSADGKYSGLVIDGTAGATLAFGDVCSPTGTSNKWVLADANVITSAAGDARGMLGVCVLAASDTQATKMLLFGMVRADAKFPTLTINEKVFLSETAGAVTLTMPTTADAAIRCLGFGTAGTGDNLFFNPSPNHVTHT